MVPDIIIPRARSTVDTLAFLVCERYRSRFMMTPAPSEGCLSAVDGIHIGSFALMKILLATGIGTASLEMRSQHTMP